MKIVEQVRPTCKTEGCSNKAMLSGRKDGKYRPHCYSCYRKRHNYPPSGGYRRTHAKRELRDTKCAVCGWGKATCDVHRVRAGGAYSKDNTLTLCPNCHRMAHEGKLTLI